MELTITVIAIWILSVCFHEFGHAITAYIGGDTTVKDKGYLTLNPIAYFSSATTLVLPLIILLIGGIPFPGAAVAINTNKLRNRVWQSLVSLAGPLFTLIFIVGITAVFWMLPEIRGTISSDTYQLAKRSLNVLIYLQIFVLMLNMLPIPPLDGWGIIEPWLPEAARRKSREIGTSGFAILLLLMLFVPAFSDFIAFWAQLFAILLGVDLHDAFRGLRAIKDSAVPLMGVLLVAWIIRSKFASPAEKGDKLLKEKKYAEALEMYDQALAKKPDARVMMATATCLLSIGKKQEGLERANKAIELDPQSTQSHGIRAACLHDMGEHKEAVEASDTAIKYDTAFNFVFPYFIKASSLNELNRPEEALEAINKFLDKEKNNVEGLYLKALVLDNLSRYDEALSVYDKMIRIKGGEGRGRLGKGILLCAIGRTEDGLTELKKLLPTDDAQRKIELEKIKTILSESATRMAQVGRLEMTESLRKAATELDS